MRRFLVLAVVALLAFSVVPAAVAQEDDTVTIRVGNTQDWETLNPTWGYLVSEWEVWNNQYEGLTTRDENLEIAPGLAESWDGSDDGLTYTYTLRDGLTWSDGEPITADDVVWTIETSKEQEWENYVYFTQYLTVTALDERTVQVTSSIPTPQLPDMGFIILPKHIWEPLGDADGVASHDGTDGVGSGPFVLAPDGFQDQQAVTMVANPNWYGWEGEEPPVDQIIFRHFENSDAMVAALESGEIDAAHNVPAAAVENLESNEDIEVVIGYQGTIEEIAVNGGAGPAQPHPALLDVEVRRAMGHAIDKQALIEDLWYGHAQEGVTFLPSVDRKWMPEFTDEEKFNFDPDLANQMLDEGGYLDSDGDGIREMPDGTNPIVIRHLVNTNEALAAQYGDLLVGWMGAIGIGVELEAMDSDQLGTAIIEGNYDTFAWGWTPGVDPDGMLSSFIADEIEGWNDANWVDERYDELYLQQIEELDEDTRIEQVHEMMKIFHEGATYISVLETPEIQAYRTDGFEGWVRQPAEDGPIMYSTTSPSYAALQPVGGGGGDDGGVNWLLIGGVAAVAVVAGVFVATRRRGTADERE
ncbi:MAG TPA: ABC transporter substrate-binding protein [Acidimicrobiia bacterium]|nr:ABC transporter substrate-binding protein [Acidimicrobiia bacterium]